MIPSVDRPPVADFAPGGDLLVLDDFASSDEADHWFSMARGLPWRHEQVVMFGRSIKAPRRTLWFGSVGAAYRYSGIARVAQGWGPTEPIRRRVEDLLDVRFNFVLGTHYESGLAHVGWHADDEHDLVAGAPIAVVSLGVPRDFQYKPRSGGKATTIRLGHGSLLVMPGDFQSTHRHRVPRRVRVEGERISWSFRCSNRLDG